MKQKFLIFISFLMIVMPISDLIAQEPNTLILPGTDDFLRKEINLSTEALTNPVATEEREAFLSATGQTTVFDPIGDVLNRVGNTSSLQTAWGDVIKAQLSQNIKNQMWVLDLWLAAALPQTIPDQGINFLFYADTDGKEENNEKEGVRINTDQSFIIKHNREDNIWYIDYRWYNSEADFWAMDKTTNAVVEVKNNQVTLMIPFAEIPATANPSWRAGVALLNTSGDTQIDMIPQIGFPPPKGESYPETSFQIFESPKMKRSGQQMIIGSIVLISLIVSFIIVKKRP
ncbi:hypothetical protein CO172_03085 [Candidatus Uhrbacteria bacterium CG_4_9_14_3_um_filter_36_7]|uniref:Uncharacterized protein n=1 Tax=Candidatus Uhrbacteria bacterium CG_4_9_14_3_um_filter_36_7 TaxID=1975033 RepID=A0A2M7XGV1_9BACT|nr:MAG: hypothetical protein CO172_03085 [Candidatus Uhrbacteria bacterium CG_4_9_14_3_um_filter_36_7]